MKNMTGKFLLAATLTLFAVNANAILTLEISTDSNFAVGPGTLSATDGDNDGAVFISSGLGSWVVNVVTGLSSPIIGTDYIDEMDLNSVNVSGGAGTLYLRLSDMDFDKLDAVYRTGFGGTTDGSVSFKSYADATNTLFGTGTLLSDSGVISTAAFSGNDSGFLSMAGPYSLSIYATVTHSGAGQVSSFDYNVKVAEPATLALLGLGLAGLGFARRRKV